MTFSLISCDVALVSSSEMMSSSFAEDVALRGGEQVEQVVLELLELDRELVLLCDELRLLLEQVGALLGDDDGEQLVLEALLGDGEVDERRLRLHLGDVVRVGQADCR